MKPTAFDFDETSGRTMRRLDARDREHGDDRPGADDGGGEKREANHV
jgi:hypothetical protein